MKKNLLKTILLIFCLLVANNILNAQSAASLTSTSPATNSQNGALTANVSATFNDVMIAPSASNTAMRVFGNKRGAYTYSGGGTYSGVNTSTITYNPTRTFLPGELLSLVNNGNTTNGIINSRPTNSQFWASAGVGKAQFSSPTSTTITNGAVANIETADLDGDADLDMVFRFTNSSGYFSLAISLNDGSGLFGTPTVIFNGYNDIDVGAVQVNSFAVGDVNHDGDIDVAASVSGLQSIYVFSNNGAASFGSTSYYKGEDYVACQLTDMDADGDLEFVCANQVAGTLEYYPNSGTGNFSAVSTLVTTVTGLSAFVTGDFNNDRRMDIASTRNTSSFVRISLQQTTLGTFTTNLYSTGITGTSLSKIKILDADSDGDIDVAALNDNTDNLVVFMINNGAGVLTAGFNTGASATIPLQQFDLADFDGDGDMDLFTSYNAVNGYNVYKNASGNFSLFYSSTLGATQALNAVATGDLDGDGDIDLATATTQLTTRRLRMLQNQNDQVYTNAIASPTCVGNQITVSWTVSASLPSINDYFIQLSDANGSFASPIFLGSVLNSGVAGSTIVTIPSVTPGSGYRIRAFSNTAGVNSNDNGSNIQIFAGIDISVSPFCDINQTYLTASSGTSGVTYSWSPSTGLDVTTGADVIASPSTTTTYYCTGTSPLGCVDVDTIVVQPSC